MTELKNLLIEKNISVKEFSKITKVKEKKLNRVIDNQAFFSDAEASRVSAFLGVSKNELYHGVVERKGELSEVTAENNINHFRYYYKTRFNSAIVLLNIFAAIGGLFFVGVAFSYIILMLAGITGLPTILREIDVLLLGYVIPACLMFCLCDIAKEKTLEKKATPFGTLNVESIGISLMLIAFAIVTYVNDFSPVVSLVLTIVGAVLLSVITIFSPFKKLPFSNRVLQLVLYMIPTALLSISEAFVLKYVKSITPVEEGATGEALATAADLFGIIFALLIFGVLYFSLISYYKAFLNATGSFFTPIKKVKSITKCKLAQHITIAVVIGSLTFLSIWVSQGVYLKYIYTNVLGEHVESTNWTAEYITDFDNQFKKGEYQVVEYEGMQVKIPKGYKLDKETEYTITYKKDDQNSIIFSKPINSGIGDSAYAESALTPEQRASLEECYIEGYGFYPQTMYEWHKIMGMVTPDDIDIFNPKKTVAQYTVLTMKAIATTSDFSYYLYENDGLYASITTHLVENNEKGNRDLVSIAFGSMDLEYTIMFTNPVQDENANVEKIEKILNSIEMS